MKKYNSLKQELIAWSIVLGLFGALTVAAIQFDKRRVSPKTATSFDESLHQPGYSTVLSH